VNPNDSLPQLPSTAGYVPPDQNRHPDYVPAVPSTQSVPKQEPGVRAARALPYELFVRASADGAQGMLTMRFVNTGRRGAVFLVYSADGSAPRTYTVEAGKRLEDRLPLDVDNAYDYTVYGPNGYLRRFAGKEPHNGVGSLWTTHGVARPDATEGYDVANGNLQLTLENFGSARCEFRIVNAYEPNHTIKQTVIGGRTQHVYLDLRNAYGWYDLTISVDSDASFARRFAGHVETGRPSFSDPALGG
jgi:phospholipase C